PRRHDRARDGRHVEVHPLWGYPRAGRLARRDLPRDGARQRRRDRARPERRPTAVRGMSGLLATRDLAASYGGPVVLDGVTFELERGERIGILGPNGGGKSTLFRVLLGELRPLRGSVRRPPRLGFVPQTERSRLDYPVSALDVALMGTLSRVPWWRPVGRAERRAALAVLDRVGLAALAGEQFGELSGGQRPSGRTAARSSRAPVRPRLSSRRTTIDPHAVRALVAPVHAAGAARAPLRRRRRCRARLLDRPLRARLQRRVARARALPGAR